MSTKFFHYSQNNSGGSFAFDEKAGVTHHVVIEAYDYNHANARAENIGLYFDGYGDCGCCGNRWYEQDSYHDATDKPTVYGEPVDEFDGMSWMDPGKEIAVHYLDGRVEWHGVTGRQSKWVIKKGH